MGTVTGGKEDTFADISSVALETCPGNDLQTNRAIVAPEQVWSTIDAPRQTREKG